MTDSWTHLEQKTLSKTRWRSIIKIKGMIGKFSLISSFLPLSWILIKTFQSYGHVESISLFRLTSRQWNSILLLSSDKFWDKKGFVFLSNPMLVRSTDMSIFSIFQCFERMFSIDEPHYCFSASPNRWHVSMSFLVTLTFYFSRTLTILSSISLLLTD